MVTKIPHKVNLSPLPSDDPMFDYQSPTYVSEDCSDSSGSDEGHDRDFLPPTEKPVVPEEDMANPQPERLQILTLPQRGGLSKLRIIQIWSVMTQFSTLMKILHNISINTGLKFCQMSSSKRSRKPFQSPN